MNDQHSTADSDQSSDLSQNDRSESNPVQMEETSTNSSSLSQSPETILAVQSEIFQGPLPSPHVLEEFDRVVPGLARKIVDRAELEMNHRHSMEQKALDAKIQDRRAHRSIETRGQFMAFAIVVVFVGIGLYLILHNHPKIGGTLITTTIVVLAGAFLTGRISKPKAKSEKTDQSEEKNS